jgi:hypothetical protein
MSDPTPETLLATVNQIHERFMGMMGRVPEGIANDLAEVQLAAAAWEEDRKRMGTMEQSIREFVYQAESVKWKIIDPPIGKGESSLDEAYKDMKASLSAVQEKPDALRSD